MALHRLVLLLLAAIGAQAANIESECRALMEAAAEGKVEVVKGLLAAENADVNCKSEVGETPLHVSGIWGKIDVLRLLLAAGANVNVQATGEHSLMMAPLHWYVHPGYTEGVEALIAAGADVNMVVRNEDGDHITALDIVERYGEDSERHTGAKAALLRAGAKHAAEMEAEEGETQKEDL